MWFIFQKSKYIYDWDKKCFHTIEFPINKSYEEYMESKGYLDDEAIEFAEKEFGRNEMIMVSYTLIIIINLFIWMIIIIVDWA